MRVSKAVVALLLLSLLGCGNTTNTEMHIKKIQQIDLTETEIKVQETKKVEVVRQQIEQQKQIEVEVSAQHRRANELEQRRKDIQAEQEIRKAAAERVILERHQQKAKQDREIAEQVAQQKAETARLKKDSDRKRLASLKITIRAMPDQITGCEHGMILLDARLIPLANKIDLMNETIQQMDDKRRLIEEEVEQLRARGRPVPPEYDGKLNICEIERKAKVDEKIALEEKVRPIRQEKDKEIRQKQKLEADFKSFKKEIEDLSKNSL